MGLTGRVQQPGLGAVVAFISMALRYHRRFARVDFRAPGVLADQLLGEGASSAYDLPRARG